MRIGIIILAIGVFALQVLNYRKRKDLEKEKQNLEQTIMNDNQHYQEIVDANRNLKHISHDLQKHINTVQNMMNTKDENMLSGNAVVDAVVGQKKANAQEKGIRFDCNIDNLSTWKLKAGETISLLANLLDNAIEAALKVKSEPYIMLNLAKMESEFIIEIVNSKISAEKPLETGMSTTKKDCNNHGYGTGIIKEIVERNGGDIKMDDAGESFWVVVRL